MTQINSQKKGFAKIDRVLYGTAKNYKLEPALNRHKARQQWDNILSGFLENANGLTKILDLKDGVLVVASLDKKIAYEIKVLTQRILYALNNFLGGQFVFAIQVVV